MDTLLPNPSGCGSFEPNSFRRDKCRNCGQQWRLHLGVISEATVQSFVVSQQEAQMTRVQSGAVAKAKARASAKARQRAQTAAEDQWLRDDISDAGDAGETDVGDSDSSGDGVFRMFSMGEMSRVHTSVVTPRRSRSAFKVTNLIDFSECDVKADPSERSAPWSQSGHPTNASSSPAAASSSAASRTTGTSPVQQIPAREVQCSTSVQASGFSTPMRSKDDVLLEEIQYLRQMLADSNEEKRIQVSIIQDELADKQRTIEALSRQAPANSEMVAQRSSQLPEDRSQTSGKGACDSQRADESQDRPFGAGPRSRRTYQQVSEIVKDASCSTGVPVHIVSAQGRYLQDNDGVVRLVDSLGDALDDDETEDAAVRAARAVWVASAGPDGRLTFSSYRGDLLVGDAGLLTLAAQTLEAPVQAPALDGDRMGNKETWSLEESAALEGRRKGWLTLTSGGGGVLAEEHGAAYLAVDHSGSSRWRILALDGSSACNLSKQGTALREQERLEQLRLELEGRLEECRQAELRFDAAGHTLQEQMQQSEAQSRTLRDEVASGKKQRRELERVSLELHRKLAGKEDELRKVRDRLAWWEAGEEALATAGTEADLSKWERAFWQASQRSLARLAGRRLDLAVSEAASAATAVATESMLCKICYDAPVACALLPCRHHAFCIPCSRRVESSREPVCPLCRTAVTGVFETFAG